ncbi:phage Gp19/Gp15/Gp42 family protein [Lachnospiraceae bacterium ZAX-1]
MIIYATVEDFEARYGEQTEIEQEQITVLLRDASAAIIAAGGKQFDLADWEEDLYTSVCCAIVHRVTISPAGAGISQTSQSAGGYSESFSYVNPTGDIYITNSELKRLGLKKQAIGTIPPKIHRFHHD